jgi:hypothetical protein
MLKANGFNDAIIGTASKCGSPDIVAYDVNKIISILMDRDDMTDEEAWEFYEFNILGSYVGELTPIFIYPTT